ncbi:MAG: ATP-binding cassette domain-containing protein [Deltaproteobacteria bacterium]|nr:ATP-binding cassette domain-containing protein [Deltaproteobacteria bacterium]MBW2016267.1 ATP-binding cassette domain-containing protein [Deltaproteobacteria bacterium]MBW2128549.1 ATP-binding cassette domain-containing protein [Deltaproteobacteria bacterium]MBW2303327.1 ATP-binding cassette domain-containing protein [Deltaproteobacteria bacterium]
MRRPIISVRELVGGYGEEIVLDHVSFDVYEGEIFVVLGGSGCGKSTLLKHMVGLLQPVSGKIIIDGDDITRCDEGTFRKVLRKIGILYQSGALLGSMTLAENVALPILEHTDLPKETLDTLVTMKLGLVGLEGYEDYLPSEISGGMKKRAGLARAMALTPKILFFDEPSAGLDPVTSAGLDELIIKINQNLGTTMVIVTHELQSIFTVAHRVIMLDKRARGIIAEGDPHYLKDHSKNRFVKQFFNRQAENMR